jgi:hypothetical protein
VCLAICVALIAPVQLAPGKRQRVDVGFECRIDFNLEQGKSMTMTLSQFALNRLPVVSLIDKLTVTLLSRVLLECFLCV